MRTEEEIKQRIEEVKDDIARCEREERWEGFDYYGERLDELTWVLGE